MNRPADAAISAATAQVAAHGAVDIGIGRLRLFLQQSHGGHDLSRLAVAALRHLLGQPGLFDRVVLRNPFDGDHLFPLYVPDRSDTRALGMAVNMDRAGAAQPLATT